MAQRVPDADELARYHAYARDRGPNMVFYRTAVAVVRPLARTYLRLQARGAEHVPASGPTLVVANHRSFLDPFLVACLLPHGRPLRFMAKAELFRYRPMAWFFSRGGGFPVRRGHSDPDAIATAESILDDGGLVGIFPEGTRLRRGGLGQPRRGAGRLALRNGAVVVPVTILGSERVRRCRVLVLPARCQVHANPGCQAPREQPPTPESAAAVIDRAWASIERTWAARGGSPEPGRR